MVSQEISRIVSKAPKATVNELHPRSSDADTEYCPQSTFSLLTVRENTKAGLERIDLWDVLESCDRHPILARFKQKKSQCPLEEIFSNGGYSMRMHFSRIHNPRMLTGELN
jgi:hypothetical protein